MATLIKHNGEWKKVDADSLPVTEMPASADVGTTLLYTGETTASYITGHVYQYQQTSLEPVAYGWVDISMNGVQPLFQIDLNGASPSTVYYSSEIIYQALDNGVTSDGVTVIKGHFYAVQESEASGDSEWVDLSDLGSISASDVTYNNSSSGLSASNVQGAIDEVNTKVNNLPVPVTPKGTIAFASLPVLASVEVGWMYNISDDFITTSDFVIPGISEKAGSNVYCIDTGSGVKKWDVFATGGETVVVDQTYDAESTNAQSGTAVAGAVAGKVDKVTGKGLSTNDFTNEDKAKLDSIDPGTSISLKPKVEKKWLGGWLAKTWTGLTNFDGSRIWTDGTHIYYSSGTTQYVLDKETSTWSTKTWTGLTSFNGQHIWTDGTNIYYSYNANQYVLDKETSTWSVKTWTGLTSFNGEYIWTDGTCIYYSYESNQYVLDKETSTWTVKTWTGLTNFYADQIWTDGTNIYYSYNANQYVLDKETSTWTVKTWSGLTDFNGNRIWADGTCIYYSYESNQYVLNKETSAWSIKTWSVLTNFNGYNLWTDGTNIYYSINTNQYVLDKTVSVRT